MDGFLVPKLQLGNAISASSGLEPPARGSRSPIAKQSFEDGRSQAGAWERDGRDGMSDRLVDRNPPPVVAEPCLPPHIPRRSLTQPQTKKPSKKQGFPQRFKGFQRRGGDSLNDGPSTCRMWHFTQQSWWFSYGRQSPRFLDRAGSFQRQRHKTATKFSMKLGCRSDFVLESIRKPCAVFSVFYAAVR